jgi:hypothetical protein
MTQLPTPIKKNQPNPEILTEQATFNSLSKEVIDLRKELKEQRNENKNFIYWIIGGVVAIVAVVAIEIIIFHTRTDKDTLDYQNQYFRELSILREKIYEIELQINKESNCDNLPAIQEIPKQ